MEMNFSVRINKNTYSVKVGDTSSSPVRVEVDGQTFEVEFQEQGKEGARLAPAIAQAQQEKTIAPKASPSTTASATRLPTNDRNAVLAPMPGKILKVNVKPGDSVSMGDVVCILEAMKMEQLIKTGRDGVVAEVPIQPGQTVAYSSVLVRFRD